MEWGRALLSVIIVNYNDYKQVIDYVNRIKNYKIISKIIIVDNKSTDNSYQKLKGIVDKNVILVSSGKNGGYGYGNNFGINYAVDNFNSDYALISNADVYYEEDFLVALLHALQDKKASVAAGTMINQDGTITPPWRIPSGFGYVFNYSPLLHYLVRSNSYSTENMKHEIEQVDCVPGSLLMVNTKDFQDIDGYDESIFLYCEEMVLGIRMKRAGKKTIFLPGYKYIHMHARTESEKYMQQKMIWKSRKKVLVKYYGFGKVKIGIVKLIESISLFVWKIRNIKAVNR